MAGGITDATLLVKPEVALAQAPAIVEQCMKCGGPIHEGECRTDLPPVAKCADCGNIAHSGPCPTTPASVTNTKYFGIYEIDVERYGRDLTRLSQEILQHLASLDGVDLDVTIEIQARKPDGFPDDKVRVILENARALKFRQSGFETD